MNGLRLVGHILSHNKKKRHDDIFRRGKSGYKNAGNGDNGRGKCDPNPYFFIPFLSGFPGP